MQCSWRTQKAEEPGDDIVSTLVDADADGQLSEAEFGMFVVTLTVAGNETTRNSITQGMMAFTDYPDQWELYKAQRPKTAADEIIRWASPITAMQRTALVDTELGGVQIKKGQRLVLFYRSANSDEDVFDYPFTFNILREPNPHLGFGGTGAHYCVGANLARMTIDLMFNAIADQFPTSKPVAAPERLRSSMINGIKHWQVDYHNRCDGLNWRRARRYVRRRYVKAYITLRSRPSLLPRPLLNPPEPGGGRGGFRAGSTSSCSAPAVRRSGL